jgi:ribosome-associated protein
MNTTYTGNQVTDNKPGQLQAKATRNLVLQAAEDLKASNLVVLDVRGIASYTEYMIFARGSSTRHLNAIA